ncbi:hypothetical protein [Actinocorallia longicatena]|uniref:ATP-binding protein n=1 Tax=Actinocorallia longicatena TaxID=111803 RepID=A0ABP6QAT2_9ACTN
MDVRDGLAEGPTRTVMMRAVEEGCLTASAWTGPEERWASFARAFTATVLGKDCGGSDDARLVMSELMGNAARYGGEGAVHLEITHRGGMVLGMLQQLGACAADRVETPEPNAAELAALRSENPPVTMEPLPGGRGLLVIEALTVFWRAAPCRAGLAMHFGIFCGCGLGS